jgi:hypothetical protein
LKDKYSCNRDFYKILFAKTELKSLISNPFIYYFCTQNRSWIDGVGVGAYTRAYADINSHDNIDGGNNIS